MEFRPEAKSLTNANQGAPRAHSIPDFTNCCDKGNLRRRSKYSWLRTTGAEPRRTQKTREIIRGFLDEFDIAEVRNQQYLEFCWTGA